MAEPSADARAPRLTSSPAGRTPDRNGTPGRADQPTTPISSVTPIRTATERAEPAIWVGSRQVLPAALVIVR